MKKLQATSVCVKQHLCRLKWCHICVFTVIVYCELVVYLELVDGKSPYEWSEFEKLSRCTKCLCEVWTTSILSCGTYSNQKLFPYKFFCNHHQWPGWMLSSDTEKEFRMKLCAAQTIVDTFKLCFFNVTNCPWFLWETGIKRQGGRGGQFWEKWRVSASVVLQGIVQEMSKAVLRLTIWKKVYFAKCIVLHQV